ncbi:ABC transporter substrate-binding protein [Pelagibius sp.]|uniref:ABC transporter substrate-binding protein n=1 Tax=Pelagibius sp. TaxID=1931238 RepID=UPI00261701F6|nr:extracellular solute-binding protein [Pelagibius sp.]
MRKILCATASGLTVALGLSGAALACSPDFSGVTLKVGSQTGPFIASAMQAAGEGWEKQTCGKVEVVEFPFGELYPKYLTAMVAGEAAFDVITFAPAWTPDFAPYLSEMPEKIRTTAEWEDIAPVYRDRLMVWNGKHLSQTIDGDLHTLSYRLDLFNDPKEQAAFKAKYGYDLAAPTTWDQYYDIAEFFTRPEDKLWGTAEAFRRGGQQFWFFFTHAASYTNNPNNPGSMFFDPETMDAQVNNEGWVKALEDYIRSVGYAPPGALNFTSGDIRTVFAGGQVAMNFDWGDTGTISSDKAQSQIAGSVGSALTPGSTRIWNHKTNAWDEFDEPVHSPFMAYGGWQAAVPQSGNNIDASWHYVEWASNPDNSGQAAVTGGSGVNPYRFSHFTNLDRWLKTFSPEEAKMYLAAQRGSLEAPNVALDMRLPGYFSYTEELEIELSKALVGDVEPKAALDAIAAKWNALTDEFGREEQLAAYRSSMGLPPLK